MIAFDRVPNVVVCEPLVKINVKFVVGSISVMLAENSNVF